MSGKRVCLVTGAAGFVGKFLCAELAKQGFFVRGVARAEVAGPWDELQICDLTEEFPENMLSDVEAIFHLAGKAHAADVAAGAVDEYHRINTRVTERLVKAAEQSNVSKLVFFSSVKALCEDTVGCIDENAENHPETPYGKSKLAAEKAVLAAKLAQVVVLRLSMVYGLGCKGNLPLLMQMANANGMPALPELQNQRSMVAVSTVAEVAIQLLDNKSAHGQAFNVCDAKPYSTTQLLDYIYAALEKPQPKLTFPLWLLKSGALLGDGFIRVSGKSCPLNSLVLEKLTGDACYSPKKLQDITGLALVGTLEKDLKAMADSLS